MSKALTGGVWKKDSVKDVAESVGISNLPDEVAAALAGDVEYRLWELIEESVKFMSHSRRTRLKVDDVDAALKVRNLEPLWGFSTTNPPAFKKVATPTGTVYAAEDTEIDLSKILKAEMPAVPRDISYTAHWLAIEGVQPLIKENPSPAELAKLNLKAPTPASTVQVNTNSTVTPLVRHVLSRELQLYFTRLTEALGGTNSATNQTGGGDEMRDAALGSLRSDPGLHQLVPYLVSWGGEQIANHLDDLNLLQRSLDLFYAMLENPTLYIEPYLHQLSPPILTCLLTTSLPASTSHLTSIQIRTSAASLLNLIIERYSGSYPSLKPRITKTLLRGLGGEHRGLSSRWGAARGLNGMMMGEGGNAAVREWIGGGIRQLGAMMEEEEEACEGERHDAVNEVLNVLKASLLPTEELEANAAPEEDELVESYGALFGKALHARWEHGGREIVHGVPRAGDDDEAMEE